MFFNCDAIPEPVACRVAGLSNRLILPGVVERRNKREEGLLSDSKTLPKAVSVDKLPPLDNRAGGFFRPSPTRTSGSAK